MKVAVGAAEQLSLNDELAAWTRYLDVCRSAAAGTIDYERIESWAWAELQAALAAIARRSG